MKKIIVSIILIAIVKYGYAQHLAHQGFELQEILKIAESYRTAPNLSFNIDYYYSDSAHTDSIREHLSGYSKMSDGRYYTFLDSTEFIQGYQFNLTVSYTDSSILVRDRQEYADLMKLPVLDSIFGSQYIDSLKVYETDDVPTNTLFVYLSADAPYSGYMMIYNRQTYHLQSIAFYVKNVPKNDDGTETMTGLINIAFSAYSTTPVSQDFFWEDKYIYKQDGSIHLKPSYADFQLLDSTTPIQSGLPQ